MSWVVYAFVEYEVVKARNFVILAAIFFFIKEYIYVAESVKVNKHTIKIIPISIPIPISI